jgi:hypothetical protein
VSLTFDVHRACGFSHPPSPLLLLILCWVLEGYGSAWLLWGTQAPIQWVPETLSLGVKRPEREADHLPPSNAEVKNAWCYTSTLQYVFMAWCLVKHRDFTFYLLHDITITNLVTTYIFNKWTSWPMRYEKSFFLWGTRLQLFRKTEVDPHDKDV